MVLRRIGRTAETPDVVRRLPDPVDLDRDAAAMPRVGLLPGQLMETLGANG